MINAVILEDDPMVGKNLALMLEEHCPEIKVISLLDSGKMALDILPYLNYDLIFSDIELGDMDAFSLFEQLENSNQQIIFITAHDEFALHAFKLDAADYLIKPVLPEELKRSVKRVVEHIVKDQQTSNTSYSIQKSGKILIKSNDELHFLLPERIIYCEADGAYSKVFLSGNLNEYKVVTMHLKKMEKVLPKEQFFRIHDGYIVNINFIDHIIYQKRLCVLNHNSASGKTQLKISERKYVAFIDFLKNA